MPFVRISLLRGRSAEALAALSAAVHAALVAHFDVPEHDRFQSIVQHGPDELLFDRDYLGGPRSDGFVLLEIVAGRPRSAAMKAALYRGLAERLAPAGVDPEDLMVVISTTAPEDWSFGGGRAYDAPGAAR